MNYMKAIVWVLVFALTMSHAGFAGEVTYYHQDALGSTVAATDEQGNVLWREAYRPYGERILKQDGGSNKLWYTGKPHEEDMGLNYFGARWYDPMIGRFTGIDPVEFQEGNIHSFNRYAYANNNPYRYVDPDGEQAIELVLIGVAILALVSLKSADQAGNADWSEVQKWLTPSSILPIYNNSEDGAEDSTGGDGEAAKDVTKRPSNVRKKTVQDAWDNAAEGSKPASKACPTCDNDVEVAPGQGRRDWDVDHQLKWKDRDLSGMDRKQVLDEYNKDVRLRCPNCNRSDN